MTFSYNVGQMCSWICHFSPFLIYIVASETSRKLLIWYFVGIFGGEWKNLLSVWKATHTSHEKNALTKDTEPRRHTKRWVEVANMGKGKPMGSLVSNDHTYNVKAIKAGDLLTWNGTHTTSHELKVHDTKCYTIPHWNIFTCLNKIS